MKLTEKNKAKIDSMSYKQLLSYWRFAPVGSPWFQGETGEYWKKRMKEIKPDNHAQISKDIGWGR